MKLVCVSVKKRSQEKQLFNVLTSLSEKNRTSSDKVTVIEHSVKVDLQTSVFKSTNTKIPETHLCCQ